MSEPELPDDPTPEERAHYVVLRLETFIREGRQAKKGMSFRKWQDMARAEIINAITDAQKRDVQHSRGVKLLLFTLASTLVTIGFWGVAMGMGRVDQTVGALVCGIAGLVLFVVSVERGGARLMRRSRAKRRRERFKRVVELDRQIRRMEHQLKDRAEAMEKELDRMPKVGR